jgi:MFS family permease
MGRVIGMMSLSNQTGGLVGPTAAGLIVGHLSFPYIFALSTLMPLGGLLLVRAAGRDRPLQPAPGSAPQTTLAILTRPGVVPIGLLAASVGIVWGSFQAYFAIFAARGLAVPPIQIGWLIGIAGVANAFSRIPWGRLLERLPRKGPVTAAAVCGFGAGLILLPHLTGFWPAAFLLLATVPLAGLAIMGMSISAAELGGATGRGRAISVASTLFSLASGLAPALVAPAMNSSFETGFALTGLLGGGTAAAGLLVRQRVLRAAGVHVDRRGVQ